jgi:hypothetical protein
MPELWTLGGFEPFMRTLCLAILACFVMSCENSQHDDELSARKILDRLQTVPECRAYTEKFMTTISQGVRAYDATKVPHDTMIVARFKLHQDGSVSDIVISGNTNAPVAPLCIRAIKDSSPFPKWPSKMRPIVGREYLEIYYRFGFNMTPPGPA